MPTPTRVQEQTSSPLAPDPSTDLTETVILDNELAPCVAFEGWITVEPRRKSNKQICGTPKGKEVIAVEAVPDVNPCTKLAPSVCADVVGSLGAWALAGADVDSRTTSQLAPLNLGEGTPNDAPPLGGIGHVK
ncbi:hypothetical protein NC652_018965 [Populus alba x Populus x berolinensis]|nr:hypothetical protein NC652_018965 [Populus alba x Populus x berolinensis]